MIRTTLVRPAISGLLLAFALLQAAPALSAQKDIDLLQSYVGDWSGRGSLGTGDKEETVKCSLEVTSSAPTRVQFNGRCALAGGAVSLKGTLGFIEERNRFEAVMSSDSAFAGIAVGKRNGDGIDFTMRPKNPETNSDLDVGVELTLSSNKISVQAKVTDTTTSATTTASVPLERKP